MSADHNRTSMVAAFVSVALFGPALWMVLDRDPPFVVTNGRVDPITPVVNSSISVTWDVHPVRSCQPSSSATVTRAIVDSKGVKHVYAPVPAVYGTPAQREVGEIHRMIPLPNNIIGPARYSSVACYACNPIQKYWPICIELPEIPFEIVAEQ